MKKDNNELLDAIRLGVDSRFFRTGQHGHDRANESFWWMNEDVNDKLQHAETHPRYVDVERP